MRSVFALAAVFAALQAVPAAAQSQDAKRFGVRETVEQISLSPDGTKVVFLTPGQGARTVAFIANVTGGDPFQLFSTDGKPENVRDCHWSSNTRVVCVISMQIDDGHGLVGYTRVVSVTSDGKDAKLLTARDTARSLGVAQGGGEVIDWLPDASSDDVLMTRTFVPESDMGTHLADTRTGYGVERLSTATLKRSTVEQPRKDAIEYITDGYGTVRIMGSMGERGDVDTGQIHYSYRTADNRDWKPLGTLDINNNTGFNPYAVDRDLNIVYGFEKKDGRFALYRIKLDGTGQKDLVYARDDVDVDGLIQIGRRQRVVGASFVTDRNEAIFFDPALKALAASLSHALPGLPLIRFIDSSTDENRLLMWAGSDVDPGRYYVFDRTAKNLMEIMLSRPQLEGATLAQVKPIRFTAADGTQIPGYLTLPPGSNGKGLPAIVMPHGGPGARDEWGFDWLAQFFAARGYAVLQPNFRGSTGYGDAWFAQNGFKSWQVAIGDVNDGGRWLVSQGIADPSKLAIVGWSYGGYAALQSSVLDSNLFKAIVAIAPVTDLETLKNESLRFTNYRIVASYIGSGPHISEGSPARNVAKITAPVLMFHGDKDTNVDIGESRMMADRLRGAGKKVELVEFPGLDHQLSDSSARTSMLDKADTFLRASMGMAPGAK